MTAWIYGRVAAAFMTYLSRANAQEQPNVVASGRDPCCHHCEAPKKKYYSIADDSGRWLCGETCIRPSAYPVYHVFEKNLTFVRGDDAACADLGYGAYVATATHGVPGLACTLDLYACPSGACPRPSSS